MRCATLFLAGLAVLPTAAAAIAGPLFPAVRVGGSPNGTFLVILQYDGSEVPPGVRRTHFQVVRRESWDNFPFSSRCAQWSDWVPFGGSLDSGGSVLPFVTDDGKYAVFVSPGAAMFPDRIVISVYERRLNSAERIAGLTLRQLWTERELKQYLRRWVTDASPFWYEGGRFDFGVGGDEFVHTTSWGRGIRINLATGAVSR